jgi:transposase-like protein
MNEQKTDKVNEMAYYERSFTTRVGTLELKVPRTRDGHFFHPQCLNVINETKKPSWLQCWKCMYQAFQLVKYQNCGRTLW